MGRPKLAFRAERRHPEQLPGEEWRPIDGFPGYEVSNLGRVRSVRILQPKVGTKGYLFVALYDCAGRPKNYRLNRLVCSTFNGPPDGRHSAHLDGDLRNNRAANLAWATPKENEGHKYLHGTRSRAHG